MSEFSFWRGNLLASLGCFHLWGTVAERVKIDKPLPSHGDACHLIIRFENRENLGGIRTGFLIYIAL